MRLFEILKTSYENFSETMQDFLNKSFGGLGQAYSQSSIFGSILEGIKGVMQNMMFYIEDAMTEQNIFTATRKKSIYSLAKISGYDAYYGAAASGTVLISNKISNSTDKIVIEDECQLMNDSTGVTYSVDLPVDSMVIDMSKPLVTHSISILQGTWKRATATAKGEPLETIEAEVNSLYDINHMKVYVNGERWSISSCLYDMIEDEHSCVVKNGYDGGFSVMFGNGYHGHNLNEGDQITVKYISHDGSLGNISPSDDVTLKFKSSVRNSIGDLVEANDLLNITITSYICGGTDADTIANVKELVGMNSRSLVLASEDNFKMFLKRFSFVGQFNLMSSRNSTKITCIAFSKFKDHLSTPSDYLKLSKESMLLTDNQKSMIIQALEQSNKAFVATSLAFVDPIIRRYSIMCYIKLSTSTIKDSIKNSITNVISNYFMSLPTDTLFISKSELISYVTENTNGLLSFDLDFISEADEIARYRGYWNKKELHFTSSKDLSYVDVRTIYDKSDMIGLDEVGNIRLKTNLEMPIIHKCTMTYDDMTQQQVEPIQFFFL